MSPNVCKRSCSRCLVQKFIYGTQTLDRTWMWMKRYVGGNLKNKIRGRVHQALKDRCFQCTTKKATSEHEMHFCKKQPAGSASRPQRNARFRQKEPRSWGLAHLFLSFAASKRAEPFGFPSFPQLRTFLDVPQCRAHEGACYLFLGIGCIAVLRLMAFGLRGPGKQTSGSGNHLTPGSPSKACRRNLHVGRICSIRGRRQLLGGSITPYLKALVPNHVQQSGVVGPFGLFRVSHGSPWQLPCGDSML